MGHVLSTLSPKPVSHFAPYRQLSTGGGAILFSLRFSRLITSLSSFPNMVVMCNTVETNGNQCRRVATVRLKGKIRIIDPSFRLIVLARII